MDPSPTSLHREEKGRPKTFRVPDLGCTLPLFPDDIRDSMCLPPGGSGVPIHHHSDTVPQIGKNFKCVAASIAA